MMLIKVEIKFLLFWAAQNEKNNLYLQKTQHYLFLCSEKRPLWICFFLSASPGEKQNGTKCYVATEASQTAVPFTTWESKKLQSCKTHAKGYTRSTLIYLYSDT